VLPLLCLSALILAGGRITPRRRQARFLFIPGYRDARNGSGAASTIEPRGPARRGDEAASALRLDDGASTSSGLDLSGLTAPFGTISLAALEQRAKLATRSERKYILDGGAFETLIRELVPHYLILEIDGARLFRYDTVYFDTPSRTTYRQHVQRRRRRYKLRSRSYSENGPCFFEVKLKGNRGETIKRRVQTRLDEHGMLTDDSLAFLDSVLRETYGSTPPPGFAPVLSTLYRRLTLVGLTSSERITFDFDLLFAVAGSKRSIQPGRILVETKADVRVGDRKAGAGPARGLLRQLGARSVQGCSKYCLGVALTHSGLRDNPFRSLILNHFDPTRREQMYERARAQMSPAEVPQERLPAVLVTPSRQGFLELLRRDASQ
jgi:hypothetical protein